MAVPKHKVSKSRKGIRNSANFKAQKVTTTSCPNCHASVRPHCVCLDCGHYKGVKRIEIKEEKKGE
ncbi:MAG: 50S ribosomal protein L32 [Firmicutes bacterium]|nr:50S ribosomal protein L32 [Bacillota bacterium]